MRDHLNYVSFDIDKICKYFKELEMKTSIKLAVAVLFASLLAGCAGQPQRTTDANTWLCTAAGALFGGAAMAVASDDSDEAAIGGALVGAVAGMILCPKAAEAEAEEEVMVVEACATTPPPGALLDANGCAFDTDGDGVVDGVDLCQGTPSGVSVDRVGCPIDTDRDGVADYQDLCPKTPLGTIVDKDGCPLEGHKLLSLTGVNFATNSAVLTTSAKSILEEAVELLKETHDVIEVRVEGHTDSRGAESYNQALSQRRAESVVAYLVSRGVNGTSLVPVGMGENSPVASNDTVEGRAENRRVDFVVNQ